MRAAGRRCMCRWMEVGELIISVRKKILVADAVPPPGACSRSYAARLLVA